MQIPIYIFCCLTALPTIQGPLPDMGKSHPVRPARSYGNLLDLPGTHQSPGCSWAAWNHWTWMMDCTA